jgi:hypothetical protein
MKRIGQHLRRNLVAYAALFIALGGTAIALPGQGTVKPADLSRSVKRLLDDPRAYALVKGPGQVVERYSRGVEDEDVSANNTAFCIKNVGFSPKHAQVTARLADEPPKVLLGDQTACSGHTAVFFDGDLAYEEEFLIALFR